MFFPASGWFAAFVLTLAIEVLVAGGGGAEDAQGPTRTARLFDPATGGWLPLPPMPTGREGGSTAALADGSVLLVGGDDPSAEKVTATRFVPSP